MAPRRAPSSARVAGWLSLCRLTRYAPPRAGCAASAVRTPLVPFTGRRGQRGGLGLLVKPESLQPTGAFKLRGAYNAVYAVTRDLDSCAKPDGVVAHSSGNHGFAVAYAARLLGVSAAIVVPENAPAVKTDAIESAGRGTGPRRADARRPGRGHRGDRQGAGLPPGRRRSTTGT